MVKKCICGSAIPFSKGKILLIKHKKLNVWLNPGGHVEENETPIECALRETFEESGIKVKVIDPNQRNGTYLTTDRAYELPKPIFIMHQNVEYKTETHEHFDLIYLVAPIDDKNTGSGEFEMKWFGEQEIDELETYDIVKASLHKVFDICKNL
jgi:8-oxo-dGTP pyrophosphatase MutT (NUDIX family)